MWEIVTRLHEFDNGFTHFRSTARITFKRRCDPRIKSGHLHSYEDTLLCLVAETTLP